jgi:hypothetical protein
MVFFLKKYFNDFLKLDSLLAFSIALILNLIIYKNLKNAVIFALLFVVIFLFFLNILRLLSK